MEATNYAQNGMARRDSRIGKTYNTLVSILFTMLGNRNFNDITVNDLCAEAAISRSTFYAHFNDKYDLFQNLLSEIREDIVKDITKYEELERGINGFIEQNKKVITNVLRGANSETLALMREFMSSIVVLTIKRRVVDEESPNHITLFNFASGGLLNLLTWIVENNFPPDVNMMNRYLYNLFKSMTTWDADQERGELHAGSDSG